MFSVQCNNKRLRSVRTTDIHEASRGLSATAELLVRVQWTCALMLTDFDAGRLERGTVHRHVDDVAVGRSLFHISDDVRQLRPVQPPRRHSCRRIFRRSTHLSSYNLVTIINVKNCCFIAMCKAHSRAPWI